MRWFVPLLIFLATIAYIGWQNHVRQQHDAPAEIPNQPTTRRSSVDSSTQQVDDQEALGPALFSRLALLHPLVVTALLMLISLEALVAFTPAISGNGKKNPS